MSNPIIAPSLQHPDECGGSFMAAGNKGEFFSESPAVQCLHPFTHEASIERQ
jgi:hypothetical protein